MLLRAPLLLLGVLASCVPYSSSQCPEEAGDDFTSIRKFAVGLHNQGLLQAAKDCHFKCMQVDSSRPEPWLSIGDIFRQEGMLGNAEDSYRKSLKIAPTWHLAYFNLGNSLKSLDKHTQALQAYQHALDLRPPFKAAVLNNMALSYGSLNRNEDVLRCYREALQADPEFPETYNNMGSHLQALGRLEEAIGAYKTATQIRPDKGFLVNLAYALGIKGDTAGSIGVYAKAVELHPNYALAYYNLGTTLMGEERYPESEFCFRWAITLDNTVPDYYNNLATVVGAGGAKPEVIELYHKVLSISPGHETAYSNLYHAKHELCNWSDDEQHLKEVLKIVNGQMSLGQTPTVRPFHALAYPVDAFWQRKLAEVWSKLTERDARAMVPPSFSFSHPALEPERRIRIAYTSSDIKAQHPVAHLVLSLFHLHDMLSYQVICVALTPNDGSPLRAEVERKVEVFVDLTPELAMGVPAAASKINSLQPHILVNLNGYTNGGRLELFALQPAPIQVNAIGYPGTIGANFIHSIVTDRTTAPPEAVGAYTERLVYMPHAYLVNALKTSFPDLTPASKIQRISPSQRKLQITDESGAVQIGSGLGAEGGAVLALTGGDETGWDEEMSAFDGKIVLACFNTLIKLSPRVMDAWASVLRRAPNAVLWLIRANQFAVDNIIRYWEEEARMPKERLIFTGPAPKERHIRRSAYASLFMDTDAYGAHSTGTDALWAGVPIVVPPPGMSMASRVSSSLLHTVNLQHLIAKTWQDYEDIATRLSNSPASMSSLHQRLGAARWDSPLFATRRWVSDFETALAMMLESHAARRRKISHIIVRKR